MKRSAAARMERNMVAIVIFLGERVELCVCDEAIKA